MKSDELVSLALRDREREHLWKRDQRELASHLVRRSLAVWPWASHYTSLIPVFSSAA